MLKFETYQTAESSLASLGTVATVAGAGGKFSFIESNIKRANKRVVILITKKDGTSALVSCSAGVSDGVRSGKIKETHLAGLEILQGESGVPFISQRGSLVSYNVDDIKIETVTSVATKLEDLITL